MDIVTRCGVAEILSIEPGPQQAPLTSSADQDNRSPGHTPCRTRCRHAGKIQQPIRFLPVLEAANPSPGSVRAGGCNGRQGRSWPPRKGQDRLKEVPGGGGVFGVLLL